MAYEKAQIETALDGINSRLAERARQEWEKYAKEPLAVEVIGGAIYAFGSELACLRLEHKMKVGRAAYSENRTTWYYCNE